MAGDRTREPSEGSHEEQGEVMALGATGRSGSNRCLASWVDGATHVGDLAELGKL